MRWPASAGTRAGVAGAPADSPRIDGLPHVYRAPAASTAAPPAPPTATATMFTPSKPSTSRGVGWSMP